MSRDHDLAKMAEVLSSEHGQLVITELEDMFGGSCLNDNPYHTHYNLGLREALDYIKVLQRGASHE